MATYQELQAEKQLLKLQKERAEAEGKLLEVQRLQKAEREAELQQAEATLQNQVARASAAGNTAEEVSLQRRLNILQADLNELQQENLITVKDVAGQLQSAAKFLASSGDAGAQLGSTMNGVLDGSIKLNAMWKEVLKITGAMVVEADKLRAGYVKLTGDVTDAGHSFANLALANTDLALSQEELMKTTATLRAGFSQFAFVSQGVRDELTVQAATMDKLGITAGDTAETLNTLTMAFGMTTQEAMATEREMVGLAVALGKPPQEMIKEFNQALPSLAKFGDRAVEVFRGLEITARETGTSITELTAIVGDQMDTFEGSAKVAGRLNAVLGTDLVSGTELLMATEAERIEILRERLALSGQEFESMGRFQKIAVMNAAGISDMTTAAKLFGNEQGTVAEMIGETGISVAEMEEMGRAATDSFTQLKFAFMQLGVAIAPFATAFGFIIDLFLKMVNAIPGGLGTLVMLGALLAAPFTGGMSLGLAATAVAGGAAAATQIGIGDGVISNGTVTPIDNSDEVLAAKPGGPVMQALMNGGAGPGARGGGGDTTLVVKVMLDNRQLGEAIVPHIDRRVLGTS